VGRDVGLHCELAEVGVRLSHMEDQLTSQKSDELLAQLFFRCACVCVRLRVTSDPSE
jgi:hypothetical protein